MLNVSQREVCWNRLFSHSVQGGERVNCNSYFQGSFQQFLFSQILSSPWYFYSFFVSFAHSSLRYPCASWLSLLLAQLSWNCQVPGTGHHCPHVNIEYSTPSHHRASFNLHTLRGSFSVAVGTTGSFSCIFSLYFKIFHSVLRYQPSLQICVHGWLLEHAMKCTSLSKLLKVTLFQKQLE